MYCVVISCLCKKIGKNLVKYLLGLQILSRLKVLKGFQVVTSKCYKKKVKENCWKFKLRETKAIGSSCFYIQIYQALLKQCYMFDSDHSTNHSWFSKGMPVTYFATYVKLLLPLSRFLASKTLRLAKL